MLLIGIKLGFLLYSGRDYSSQDVTADALFCLNRVILIVGFVLFACAVLYVVSKRIGILRLQRTVTAAIRAGMAGKADVARKAVEDGINHAPFRDNAVPNVGIPLQQPMHDEL